MADNTRIDDLQRRVQRDPASVAFAQLAEEYRRAGRLVEALDVCLAGLAIHPTHWSARVTLGRALVGLDRLDEGQRELERAARGAPGHVVANRALAELHQRLEKAGLSAPAMAGVPDTTAPAWAWDPTPAKDAGWLAGVPDAAAEFDWPSPVEALAPGDFAKAGELPVAGDPPSPLSFGVDRDAAERAGRTIAALDQWLEAIHVARANPQTEPSPLRHPTGLRRPLP